MADENIVDDTNSVKFSHVNTVDIADGTGLESYRQQLESILAKHRRSAAKMSCEERYDAEPACILDHVYLGCFKDAKNAQLLERLGVTHLLNCTAIYVGHKLAPYGLRRYLQLGGHDNVDYDMLAHRHDALTFLDDAHAKGGRALVYCARGVNRSAAMCVSYLVEGRGVGLLAATELVSGARGTVLTNSGFREQLVELARSLDRL